MKVNIIEQKMRDDIAKTGLALIASLESESTPGHIYTVGLYEMGFPEIIIVGLPPQVGHGIIRNIYIQNIANGIQLETSRAYCDFANLPIAFIDVDFAYKKEYMLLLDNYYNDRSNEVPAIQMLWSDKNGKLPYEHGYDPICDAKQPMLGSAFFSIKIQ